MARTKQTARKSTGGKAPRKTLARGKRLNTVTNSNDLTYYQVQEFKKSYVPPPKDFNPSAFGIQFLNQFSQIFKNQKFSDVTLVVGKDKIPAHKLVLSSWSSVFRTQLADPKVTNEFVVNVDHPHLFKIMINYIYGIPLTFQPTDLMNLIDLAYQYRINPLVEYCGEILGKNVSDENVQVLLNLSTKFECKSLRSASANHLAKTFDKMLENGLIMKYELNVWEELLKSDVLEIPTEERVFEAMLDYVSNLPESSQTEALTKLAPLVRYSQMENNYLIKTVEPQDELIPNLRDFLYEAYRYKANPREALRKQKGELGLVRVTPRIPLYSKERTCWYCGVVYTQKENSKSACTHHIMACTCSNPRNWYDASVSPDCCCGGCGSSCKNCGDCKCGPPCTTSQHKESPDEPDMEVKDNADSKSEEEATFY